MTKFRRKIWLIGAGLVVSVIVATLALRREPEPAYQGRPVSFWVSTLQSSDPVYASEDGAQEAIEALGTNALPFLLREISLSEPPMAKFLREVGEKLFGRGKNKDPIPLRRERARYAFDILGTNAAPALKSLERLAVQGDVLAIHCLVGLGSHALPAITNAFAHRSHWVRQEMGVAFLSAARASRYSARDADALLPALLRNRDDAELVVAIGYLSVKPEVVVSYLVQTVTNIHLSESMRLGAAESLGRLKLEPETVVRELVKLYASPSEYVRKSAVERLAGYRDHGSVVVPILVQAYSKEAQLVRAMMCRTFGSFSNEVSITIEPLLAGLADRNKTIRSAAILSIAAVRPDDARCVPALTAALNDPEGEVRSSAARALMAYGRSAQSAIPALKAAARDPDTGVRMNVEEALKRVEGFHD